MSHRSEAIQKYPTAGRIFSVPKRLGALQDAAKHAVEGPCYIYVRSIVEENVDRLSQLYGSYGVLYSMKANPNRQILRHMATLGIGADTASLAECTKALKCGILATRIQYSAPGKSDEEIATALALGLGAVVLDSERDVERVVKMGRLSCRAKIGLRVNLTCSKVSGVEIMSGGPSPFGIDDDHALELYRNATSLPPLTHLHMYAGSQVLRAQDVNAHMTAALEFRDHFCAATKQDICSVNVGGGFGIPHLSDQGAIDLGVLAEMKPRLARAANDGIAVYVESGRYLVAECGVYVSRVADLKESQGIKYAILEGGMHHFLRPVFMNETHPIVCLTKLEEDECEEYSVVGRLCTPLDCFGQRVRLPRLQVGDIVATLNAGAYGLSMSPTGFLSHPNAKEIFV